MDQPRSTPGAGSTGSTPAAGRSAARFTRRDALIEARTIALYLKELRGIVDEATQSRKRWIRQIGVLLEEVRTAHHLAIAQATGRIGADQIQIFRALRRRYEQLSPPTPCSECHRLVGKWLDDMIAACDAMIGVGQKGDLTRLHETQEHLAEGRADARRFQQEYQRLIAILKARYGPPKKRPGEGLARRLPRLRRSSSKRRGS